MKLLELCVRRHCCRESYPYMGSTYRLVSWNGTNVRKSRYTARMPNYTSPTASACPCDHFDICVVRIVPKFAEKGGQRGKFMLLAGTKPVQKSKSNVRIFFHTCRTLFFCGYRYTGVAFLDSAKSQHVRRARYRRQPLREWQWQGR